MGRVEKAARAHLTLWHDVRLGRTCRQAGQGPMEKKELCVGHDVECVAFMRCVLSVCPRACTFTPDSCRGYSYPLDVGLIDIYTQNSHFPGISTPQLSIFVSWMRCL